MSKVNLPQLAQEIHAAAVEKGFWDVEDALEKHCAKMISELGEVVQADRASVMYEVERDGAKPEGVVAELADFVMMLLDMCVAISECVGADMIPDEPIENWNENAGAARKIRELQAYQLVGSLATELVSTGTATDNAPYLHMLYAVNEWAKGHCYDLWDIIRQKMEYNKSRPALHGRAY